MALTIYSDEQAKWHYKAQSAWGTAIAMNASGFKEIIFEKSTYPAFGVNKDVLPNNRGSRVFSLTDSFTDSSSGPFDISFSTLLGLDRAADLLYAVLQNRVSQGAATSYQKVYRPHASQPDFTANAGYFFTLVWVPLQLTAQSVRYSDCILKSLSLEFTKEGTGISNIVRASGVITARKVEINQDFTGTSTAPSVAQYINPYAFSVSALTITDSGGASDLTGEYWKTFTLNINNGAVGENKDSSGNPVSFFLLPNTGITASIGLYYNTYTAGAIYSLRSGTTIPLTLKKGTTGNAGFFEIALNGTITNDPVGTQNSQMVVPLDLQVGNTTATATDACTITIADSISQ